MNKKIKSDSTSIKDNSKPIPSVKKHIKPLLSVKDLNMMFKVRGNYKKVLDNVTFDVEKGDFFGIIGESGSGKTTTGKVIIKLHQSTGGVVEFDNQLISQPRMSISKKRWMHKNIQMIFQDPMSSMDPIKNVLKIVSEPLIINGIVQKEAIDFIKNLNIIRKYFKYRFNTKNDLNLIEFKKNYYISLIDIYEKWTKKIRSINIGEVSSLFDASEMVDSILSDLLDDLQINSEKTYVLNKKQTDLIKENVEKYQNGQLEEIDIEYYDALTKLKNIKKLRDKSPKHLELENSKNDLNESLEDLNKNFFNTYLQENKNYFVVLRSKILSNIKTSKQSRLLSKDNFLYLYYHLEQISYLEIKNILNNVYKQYKYLNVDQMDMLFEEVESYRVDKFNSLLTDILNKKNQYDKSKTNQRVSLLKDVLEKQKEIAQYKKLINKFDNASFEGIKPTIKTFNEKRINFYNSLIEKYSKFSQENIDIHQKEIDAKQKEINSINDEIVKFEQSFESQREETRQKWVEQYELAKKEFDAIVIKRNECINNFINTDWAKHKDYKRQQNIKIKEIIGRANLSIKKFKNAVVAFLDEISKREISGEDSFIKRIKKFRYIRTIRNSLNPKWKTQKIIKYQYKNTLNSFKIVTWLHNSPNYLFSFFWYFSILKIITTGRVYDALASVGLKHEHAYRYPHEFSGGQRQRIVIARALITKPKLIIADEPISALDVSIQSQVINIMKRLAKEHGVTFLFIAHDLSMVSYACNKVIIMHNGKIVEKGDADSVFKHPTHPYTKTLFNAAPELSKIHVDLASFDEEMNYDKNYGPLNQPKFESLKGDKDHQVFATPEQFKEWTKA